MVQMLDDGSCSRCHDWARDCSCEQELMDELIADLEAAGFAAEEDELCDVIIRRPVPGFGEYTINCVQRSATWMIRANGLHGRISREAELGHGNDHIVRIVQDMCERLDQQDWHASVV